MKINRLAQRTSLALLASLIFTFMIFYKDGGKPVNLDGGKQTHSNDSSSGKTMYDPKWDDLAIALKSGKDVALERVPIQLLTFLADVRNKIIIGDDNVTIGEYEMIDVVNKHYNTLGNTLRKSKIYCRNHVRTRSLETE